MLDLLLRSEVPDNVWSGLKHRVLGEELDGPTPGSAALPIESQRNRQRTPLEGRAIAHRGGMRLGVLLRDVSHMGIGIGSPLQLFPNERLTVDLHPELRLTARVRRCRRRDTNHYACGLEFEPGPLTVGQFRDLRELLAERR